MRRLRIGLFPFSSNFSHPADRRRIVSWAHSRNHDLLIGESRNVDLLFITEGSDFLELSRIKGPPKVFDLIDGYLNPQWISLDLIRGTSKSILRQHKTYPRTYSSIVKETCSRVELVICSSPEQMETITPHNTNVRVILDNHSEFPFVRYQKGSDSDFSFFWEGTSHTLRGLEKLIASVNLGNTKVNIVTDPIHPRFLGKYFKEDVVERLNKRLGEESFQFLNWSVDNVISASKRSSLAILPIDLSDRIQVLKPENRILIMFRLGLPCLASDLKSYQRIEKALNAKVTCSSNEDWLTSIEEFRSNPELLEEQVTKGQRYLLENHTEEILNSKWDEAIECLV